MSTVIGWFWQIVIWTAIIAAAAWILTHPTQFAHAIVGIIGGIATVVTTLFNGISGLFG